MISEASLQEPTLLFHSPEELEMAINEDRAVVLEENGAFVGFCFWKPCGAWLELDSAYIMPAFRGQFYVSKLFSEASRRLSNHPKFKRAFLFTRVPVIKKLVVEYGFRSGNFFDLPPGVWLKILYHRLRPWRIFSYAKYFRSLARSGPWQLFVFRQD
mgnify:CR=1 FL=1